MQLSIKEPTARAKSRLTAHRLISLNLRLMDMWYQTCGGHQEALVVMAVIAITGDRLTRIDLDEPLRDMSNPIPMDLLGRCNLSSISAATGLNRETTRRVVNGLIERGTLMRSPDRSINFVPGRIQSDGARRLNELQLEEFCRTSNALLRDGVLGPEPDGAGMAHRKREAGGGED